MIEQTDYSKLTLSQFISKTKSIINESDFKSFIKGIDKVVFEKLYEDQKNLRFPIISIFQNIGSMGTKVIDIFNKSNKQNSFLGKIKSKFDYFDDYKFIAYKHQEEIYLFLDQGAINFRLSQVHIYNEFENMFVPVENTSLIEFFIEKKIPFNL